MSKWIDTLLRSKAGELFLGIIYMAVAVFLMATGMFVFGNLTWWVFEGEWNSTGLGIYLRFSALCGLATAIGVGGSILTLIITKNIDRNDKKVEEHNSKLG